MYTEEIIVRKCNTETPLEAELKPLGRHCTDQKSGLWASVDKSNVVILVTLLKPLLAFLFFFFEMQCFQQHFTTRSRFSVML